MKPHFFGDGGETLYGVYDEPRVDADRAPAVVACYPIAGEYMRAHRAFRQLANLLTRAGAHVLRFDYAGSGDSWGDPLEVRLEDWLQSVERAVEEMHALTHIDAVTLVGLRFGASLACLASDRVPSVEHVVGWDPIVDGARYVRDLEAIHEAEQQGRGGGGGRAGTIGVHGFPVAATLREEIAEVDLLGWTPRADCRTDVVVSSESEAWSALGRHLGQAPNPGRYEVVPSAGNWEEADVFGSALIPQQIIQSVVQRVMDGAK